MSSAEGHCHGGRWWPWCLAIYLAAKLYFAVVQHAGQVYIPLMNYLLAVLCLIITGTFQTSDNIGKAYGGATFNTPLALLLDV